MQISDNLFKSQGFACEPLCTLLFHFHLSWAFWQEVQHLVQLDDLEILHSFFLSIDWFSTVACIWCNLTHYSASFLNFASIWQVFKSGPLFISSKGWCSFFFLFFVVVVVACILKLHWGFARVYYNYVQDVFNYRYKQVTI